MRYPLADEINVNGSLEEQHAVKLFLGRSIREAEDLCKQNVLCFMEHLQYMGPRAFCYFVHAAILYLTSGSAAEDGGGDGAVSSFIHILEVRLRDERDQIAAVLPVLRKTVQHIIDNWTKFFFDDEIDEIEEDLRCKCENLLKDLALSIVPETEQDSRDLKEVLSEVSDCSEIQAQRLSSVERLMLEAIIRLVDSGAKVTSEERALDEIVPSDRPQLRSHPSYASAFAVLRRRGLLSWHQDKVGAWEIRPTCGAIARLEKDWRNV